MSSMYPVILFVLISWSCSDWFLLFIMKAEEQGCKLHVYTSAKFGYCKCNPFMPSRLLPQFFGRVPFMPRRLFYLSSLDESHLCQGDSSTSVLWTSPIYAKETLLPQFFGRVHFHYKGCLVSSFYHHVLYIFLYLMQTV